VTLLTLAVRALAGLTLRSGCAWAAAHNAWRPMLQAGTGECLELTSPGVSAYALNYDCLARLLPHGGSRALYYKTMRDG